MTKNPLYNALAAFGYIIFIAGIMYTLTKTASNQPDNNFLIPIFVLSLLVLSAATMSYIFFYTPLTLFLSGEQKSGTTLFLQTIAIFACLTIIAFFVMFFAMR